MLKMWQKLNNSFNNNHLKNFNDPKNLKNLKTYEKLLSVFNNIFLSLVINNSFWNWKFLVLPSYILESHVSQSERIFAENEIIQCRNSNIIIYRIKK